MKTLTEFFGRNLKTIEEQMATIQSDAAKSAEEALKTEGKTDEEIQAALPEATKTAVNTKITELTKLEGDKINWLFSALGMVKGKRGNIKRVLVMSAAEGEKVPGGLQEIDGKYFSIELFPEAGRPVSMADSRDDRGGRDGKGRGGKGGKGGRDGGKGRGGPGGDDRRPRRNDGASAAPAGTSTFVIKTDGTGMPTRPAREPSERRPRRPAAAARAPLTDEQKAEMAAKKAERDQARATKDAEFTAKREAATAAEPQYDGKTNRIKAKPPGSMPETSGSSEAASSQAEQSSPAASETSNPSA